MSRRSESAPEPVARESYRLTVAYVGTRYGGWQRQPNAPSVQQVLEEALGGVLGQPTRVVGAGRTDAGVHARAQTVSLAFDRIFPVQALVRGTNRFLPADVRVLRAERVPGGFDARRHAEAKCYLYRLDRSPVIDPFEAPFVAPMPRDTSLSRLREALEALPGRHDFSAFAKSGGAHRHGLRRLTRAELREDGPLVELRFEGEGFLRGMVRALVGTLLEVSRGRRTQAELVGLLGGGARPEAGANAPARGLALEWVRYPARWSALESYPRTPTGRAGVTARTGSGSDPL